MSWTWSLAVEEQFYIVFPLALLIALRISRPLTLIVVGFAVSTIVRMAIVERYGIHLPRSDHQYLFSNMLYNKPYARFPQLLSGAIVAYLAGFTGTARRLQAYPVVTSVVSLGALVAIVALSSVKQPVFRYGWPTAANFLYFSLAQVIFAVAVAAMLFVSLSGLAGGRMASRLLSWRGFYPVSQLSYSAYLIHMIIIFVGIDLGVFPLARSEAAVFGYLLVIPAVTLIAAMPLYMLVEKPMMNLRERQSK